MKKYFQFQTSILIVLFSFLSIPVYAEVLDKVTFPWEEGLPLIPVALLMVLGGLTWFLPRKIRFLPPMFAWAWAGFLFFVECLSSDPIRDDVTEELIRAGLYGKYLSWLCAEALLPLLGCIAILFLRTRFKDRAK